MDVAAGGPPALAEGQEAIGYPSDYAMSVELGGEGGAGGVRHALLESDVPMALETGNGVYTPLDLGLREAGGGFEPSFGLAPVRLPRHVGEGAESLDTDVSLIPVTEQGSTLEGGGVIDHAGVFYGGTEDAAAGAQDLSVFAKPTVGGFEFFSVLFSERSPENLYFKVGVPQGAVLEEVRPTEVRVESSGQMLARIGAPDAHDAEGTRVPISVNIVSNDTIKISVPRKTGQFDYPLTVDPELIDGTFLPYLNPAWKAKSSHEGVFRVSEFPNEVLMSVFGTIHPSEWVAYQYQTQGKSKVYELEAETLERDYFTETETLLEAYASTGTQENWGVLADNDETSKFAAVICASKEKPCSPSGGSNNNMVEWVKRVLAEGAGGFEDELYKARVWISQEEAPTVHFNATSPKIAIKEPNGTIVERENVLYPGSKGWIGPFSSTAFEMIANDPGVGVSFAVADGGTGGKTWSRETFLMSTEKDCQGVQCPEEFKGQYTYFTDTPGFTSPMPSGEYSIQGRAEDPLSLAGETHVTVRVDATPPEKIKLVNLPAGGQIGEGVYKIKAEATDGKTGEPSSGVQSLKLGMDGAEAGEPNGSCAAGPCTATGEWTINGGQLSAGPHVLTVVATDNAGNEENEDFIIYVHHASPMGVGSGSLDPQSGNYSLGASDVSIGSGLSVTRSYSSRNLTAGVEGPFGPQWTASLGSNESLEELPDGSMVLVAASGQETVFARNSKGELESPKGDANLALTMEEEKVQKIPAAYYLKNAAAGTTTKFARPEGFLQSTPTYYGQDGWQGTGPGQLSAPTGVATDTKSNVWVSDTKSDRIEEYNAQGEYVKSFGYEGTGAGAFREPHDVAVDSKGNVWVADTANNRIEEFTEAGGYERLAGTSGSGTLKSPHGIAVDSSGNVWVADTGDNRVVEFNEKGEYQREAVKTVGLRALSEPLGVAVDKSGDVWVTDAKNYRVVEFGSTGSSLKEFGSKGKEENGKFEAPTGVAVDSEGNVWVSDTVEDRVQEFNSKGEYLTQFGSAGSNGGQLKKPYFIGVNARGALDVADSENSRVERWEHATWTPTNSEGPLATSKVTYTYKTVLVKGVGTVTRPVKEVAAHLSELSCEPTIKEGCRALIFKYGEKAGATGENENEWGEYQGRLKEALFAAYNPTTKTVEEKAVAQYAYDTKGRLRAEWDPRISPALKTVYGYDPEGHVTAVSPAGQEPWLLRYGTIPSDVSSGRLLSVTRPAAATELGSRLAPQDTVLPTLSTSSPQVGHEISVSSNGSWSNGPLAYGYQWEDCKTPGVCSVIPGAVNESYYPALNDEKNKLVAVVTAFNAGGAMTATTVETGAVANGLPHSPAPEPPNPGTSAVTTIEYAVPLSGTGLQNLTSGEVKKWGQEDVPVEGEGTAVFPPDKPMGWPAKEYATAKIFYFDAEGHTVNTVNASGGVGTSEYSSTNNVIRTLSPDDRALALKEGVNSAKVAKQLDNESVYNEEGDELLETLGPEHKVKLANGSEVQARHRVKYTYDQEAPKGTDYRLVTETVDSAVTGGKEEDRRVTQTHYSGQKDLGWTLRKPTSVTVDPGGLNLTTTTLYNQTTGAVIETGTAKGIQEKNYDEELSYINSFGSYGTGPGQLREAADLTTDSSGNVWVADSQNHRVEEFSNKGEFVRAVGSQGTGNGQFEDSVMSVAVWKGDMWAIDSSVNRVEEFTTEGTFVRAFGSYGTGNGQFFVPEGMAVNSSGDLYVADRGNNRVEEFDPEGKYLKSITKIGNVEEREGPSGLALDANGNIWVSLIAEQKLQEYSPEGTLLRSFGTAGSAPGQMMYPERFTIGPETNIWVSEYGNSRVQVFTNTGEYLYGFGSSGEGAGQFQHPLGISIYGSSIYVLDSAPWDWNTVHQRIEKWHIEPPATYTSTFGSYGTEPAELREPADLTTDSSGNVWVADSQNHRVEEFNSKGELVRVVGSQGTGNGQFEDSVMSVTVSKGEMWATDSSANRVEEFTTEGTFLRAFGSYGTGNGQFNVPEGMAVNSSGDVFVTDRGNNRVEEFDPEGKYLKSITKIWNVEGGEGPSGLALDAKGDIWVSLITEAKIQEYSPEGTLLRSFGTPGKEPGQMSDPERFTIGPEGNVWVAEYGNSRVQVFTNTGEYLYGFGSSGEREGQFMQPRGISINGTSVYVLDSAPWDWDTVHQRVEKWTLKPETENGENNPHDKQMIYYTAEINSQYPECGEHVYWEGMPCKTRPAGQPEGSSAPPLPETTVTAYNMWGEPETVEEKFGSTTRTKKIAYDEAGRVLSSEETATVDTAMPKVTDTYSETTGQLVEQSTTVGEEKQTVKSVYDKLGRLTSYTDADKNTASYEYETSGDGRLTGVSDLKGSQTYAYDPTTGELTKLVDSSAKTFTASYDVEGNMTSETYPNGMSATYTQDPAGETTGLEYVKTTHCTEKCTWFSETTVPSIHGETLARSSSLASETYTYDTAGRLAQTTETPVEKGCVTRIYAYDEDSNRTSLTTREPGTGGKCATEGGTTETHTYDSGDRLTDIGVSYEPLGNMTKLPAADAGGHELASEYYVDGQVQKQTQNGQTNTYSLDPTGRVRKTIAEGTIKQTTISHYGGPGEALTWKEEGSGKYTRLIPGIDGTLCATETNGGTPTLQLHDLQGNIVATAALTETETKPLTTYNSTEYGVPINGTPPTKYSWLGAAAASSELSSGTLIMGTVSYVPQLGKPLQTQAVTPPGTAVNGAEGTPYIAQISAWSINANNATGQKDTETYQAELAAQKEAEEKSCAIGSICQTPGENYAPGEGEEAKEAEEEVENRSGTFVEGGSAAASSGLHCGTFEYSVSKTRSQGKGKYRTTVQLTFNFYPGNVPAYWKLTLFVNGTPYIRSGGGGTVDLETFGVTVRQSFTVDVPRHFPVSFVFYAETVDGTQCQVAREHPDVEV